MPKGGWHPPPEKPELDHIEVEAVVDGKKRKRTGPDFDTAFAQLLWDFTYGQGVAVSAEAENLGGEFKRSQAANIINLKNSPRLKAVSAFLAAKGLGIESLAEPFKDAPADIELARRGRALKRIGAVLSPESCERLAEAVEALNRKGAESLRHFLENADRLAGIDRSAPDVSKKAK
jgi:hypothetical protein